MTVPNGANLFCARSLSPQTVQAHGGKRPERKGVGVRGGRFLPWAWLVSCLGASAISFAEGGALFSHRSKSWSLARRSCFSLSWWFPEAKQSATEQRAGGAVSSAAAEWSDVERRESQQVSVLLPARVATFTVRSTA